MHIAGDIIQVGSESVWDLGWNAYWAGKPQADMPDYLFQEVRDEWMTGWLTAQQAVTLES